MIIGFVKIVKKLRKILTDEIDEIILSPSEVHGSGSASVCCKSITTGQMDLKVGVHEFLIFPNSPRWQRAMKSLRNPKLPISNSV